MVKQTVILLIQLFLCIFELFLCRCLDLRSCGGDSHSVAVIPGDAFVLLCALSFSFHILVIDRVGVQVDGILLSTLQFAVCAILSLVLSLIFEDFAISALPAALPYLCYMGIVSTGIGYTLQIVGQKYAEPTVASLAMSLESVFAALGGWVISGNTLAPQELLGCVLVFGAIVLAHIPFPAQRGRKAAQS